MSPIATESKAAQFVFVVITVFQGFGGTVVSQGSQYFKVQEVGWSEAESIHLMTERK